MKRGGAPAKSRGGIATATKKSPESRSATTSRSSTTGAHDQPESPVKSDPGENNSTRRHSKRIAEQQQRRSLEATEKEQREGSRSSTDTKGTPKARMSASSTGDQSNSASCSISSSSLRKRHSPNSGGSGWRREPGSGGCSPASATNNTPATASSAVHSAAASKQRKVSVPVQASTPNKEEPSAEAGGRELRYLTDFFPDQPGDLGRLTRSRAAKGGPLGSGPASPENQQQALSPSQQAHSDPEDTGAFSSGAGSSRSRSRPTATVGKKASKTSSSTATGAGAAACCSSNTECSSTGEDAANALTTTTVSPTSSQPLAHITSAPLPISRYPTPPMPTTAVGGMPMPTTSNQMPTLNMTTFMYEPMSGQNAFLEPIHYQHPPPTQQPPPGRLTQLEIQRALDDARNRQLMQGPGPRFPLLPGGGDGEDDISSTSNSNQHLQDSMISGYDRLRQVQVNQQAMSGGPSMMPMMMPGQQPSSSVAHTHMMNLAEHTYMQHPPPHPAMMNQIPVIQTTSSASALHASAIAAAAASGGGPPGSTVSLSIPGMLFDPLNQNPPNGGRNISRSAASQFIHGLVPRMQHLLGGHKAVQHDSRVTGIMEGLRSNNELRQSEAASELAEWLIMANEDNLPSHLPIREIVQALIVLLQKEHNFELMLTAARCLTNLLEAVPRSQPIVVEAVPYLLEKLKRIECIDVAEQSLTALEELSKRNSKTILSSGGIAACISHVDFFSMSSQRLAFSIASNCAMYLGSADFGMVKDSLVELTERLQIEDKRCLESVCQLFARLVENLKNHPDKLREIAGPSYRLLALVQQLLIAQPTQLSSNTFSSVVKMLRTLASKCPELAAALIRMDYPGTLHTLFTGTHDSRVYEIVERPPNQLQDMVYLVGELFPRLPTTGIFEIDSVFLKQAAAFLDAYWYWQDDNGQWQPFRGHESKLIENNKNNGSPVHDLQVGNRLYRIDVDQMVQKNLSSGKERALLRKTHSPNKAKTATEEDGRLALLAAEPELMERVVATLFPILVAIDGSSSGPALRFECLRVMLRMICPTSANVLRGVLADLPLSGHVASALASPRGKDLVIVTAALQMVHLLLEKMSDVYSPLFKKEGVAHEVRKLAAVGAELLSTPISSGSASPANPDTTRITRSHRQRTTASGGSADDKKKKTEAKDVATTTPPAASSEAGPSTSSLLATPPSVGSASRHRKRTSPEGSPAEKKGKESRRKTSSSFLQALRIPGLKTSPSSSSSSPTPSTSATPPPVPGAVNLFAQMAAMSPSSSSSGSQSTPVARPIGSRSPFTGDLSGLPPSVNGNATNHPGNNVNAAAVAQQSSASTSSNVLTPNAKEKLKNWIKKEAEQLLKLYLNDSESSGSVLDNLAWVSEKLLKEGEDVGTAPLTQLHELLKKDNISAFEMTYSGVISALHTYLVSESPNIQPPRKLRLRRFAAVFMHLTADHLRPTGEDGCFDVFEALVSKVLATVAQMEQFQVKQNDMGGIATGSQGCLRGAQALKFFQQHQIKCYLRRHPNCRDLKDYHRHGGSTIKVDPFTSISAIERYLVDKGINRPKGPDDSSGDEISDDEVSRQLSENSQDAMVSSCPIGEDRRIELLINDQTLPSHMSVLQALRQFSPQMAEDHHSGSMGNSLWMSTHTLFYRSATEQANPSAAPSSSTVTSSHSTPSTSAVKDKKHKMCDKMWNEGHVETPTNRLWSYLEANLPTPIDDTCVPSLLLMRALYGLNRYWHGLFDDEPNLPSTFDQLLPSSTFHSAKLSAKLSRQLSDFISVATQQIPQWTSDLVKSAPFLFSFMLRRSLLYCTSFGRDRALMHLVTQTEGIQGEGESGRLTPRLERRKIIVKRDDLLKTSESALQGNASSRAMLEVSFEGEAGTGFGPTLEFYSTVSRQLQNASLKMWHGASQKEDEDESEEYMIAGHGLFPIAFPHNSRKGDTNKIKKFEMVGRLMGQALVDCRILDLPLSPVFLHWLSADAAELGVPELELLDPELYKNLRQLMMASDEDFQFMEQYFTLPGNETMELMKGGRNKVVTKENLHQFIKLVARWKLFEGVWKEMEAVKRGFAQVVDPNHLALFLPEEMEQLFCGCADGGEKVWGEAAILQAIKPDHGYTHDSDQIKWLAKMLASYDREKQRKFIQFVTGSPRLPFGGFRGLNPALTVVRKTAAHHSIMEDLPSAMTCYNYLKVPAYSSYEVFCERFDVALRFIYSFHLT